MSVVDLVENAENARPENAGLENAAPKCRGGKDIESQMNIVNSDLKLVDQLNCIHIHLRICVMMLTLLSVVDRTCTGLLAVICPVCRCTFEILKRNVGGSTVRQYS